MITRTTKITAALAVLVASELGAQETRPQELWVSVFPVGQAAYWLWPDVHDRQTLYASTPHGLFATENAGFYWAPLFLKRAESGLSFAQSPASPSVMYVVTENGVWRSDDGGRSWTDISSSAINGIRAIVVHPINANVVYLLTRQEVFKSTNGGRTWGIVTPEGIRKGRWSLTVSPADPEHLLLASYRRGYKIPPVFSADGGFTWHAQAFDVTISAYPPGSVAKAESWTWLSFHPNNADLLLGLAGGQPPHLVVSRDGGTTWRDISFAPGGRPRATVHSAVWSQQSDETLYVGTDFGLLVTKNSGDTWWQLLPVETMSVVPRDPSAIYALTSDGVLKSTDEGGKWHYAHLGLPADVSAVGELYALGDHVYVPAKGGYWESPDAGATWDWREIASVSDRSMINQVLVTHAGTKYLVVDGEEVIKVTDSGEARRLRIGMKVHRLAVSPVNPDVVYAAADDVVLKSEDGGFSWESIQLLEQRRVVDILAITTAPQMPNKACAGVEVRKGYYIGAEHRLFIVCTDDGGVQWADVTPEPLSSWLPYDITPDRVSLRFDENRPSNLYVVGEVASGRASAAFRSPDGGRNWVELKRIEGSGRQAAITDIAVHPTSSSTLYLATDAGVLRSTDAGVVWTEFNDGLFDEGIGRLLSSHPSHIFARGKNGIYHLSDTSLSWAIEGWENPEQASSATCAGRGLEPEGADYIPAPVDGSRWKFSLTYAAPSIELTGTAVIRIDGTETINGQEYFKYVTTYAGFPGAEAEVTYYRRSPNGMFAIEAKHRDMPEYLEFPFPLSVGTSWTMTTPDEQVSAKVEAVQPMEYSGQTCGDCLKISYTESRTVGDPVQSQGTVYLARGIGPVKHIITRGEVTIELTLEEYDRPTRGCQIP